MSKTFKQLTDYIWVVQNEPFATNSGIFIHAGRACLIDPGIAPDAIANIARFVKKRKAVPHSLIITHGHWDHILGPEKFPNVNIIAHTRYLDILKNHGEHLRKQIVNWEKQSDISRIGAFALSRPTYAFDTALRLRIGNAVLDLLHAPGHAPDQIAIYQAETGMLWAGDMLSDIEIPMVMDCLDAYEQTLENLAGMDVRVLIPGHGNPTTNSAEIRARFDQDRAYLAELRTRVSYAVETGLSPEQTLAHCEDIPTGQPADPASHKWNVENVFAELGGETEAEAGWEQEWEQ